MSSIEGRVALITGASRGRWCRQWPIRWPAPAHALCSHRVPETMPGSRAPSPRPATSAIPGRWRSSLRRPACSSGVSTSSSPTPASGPTASSSTSTSSIWTRSIDVNVKGLLYTDSRDAAAAARERQPRNWSWSRRSPASMAPRVRPSTRLRSSPRSGSCAHSITSSGIAASAARRSARAESRPTSRWVAVARPMTRISR